MKKIISVLLSALFIFSSSTLVSADPIVLDQDWDDDELYSEEKIQRKFSGSQSTACNALGFRIYFPTL